MSSIHIVNQYTIIALRELDDLVAHDLKCVSSDPILCTEHLWLANQFMETVAEVGYHAELIRKYGS